MVCHLLQSPSPLRKSKGQIGVRLSEETQLLAGISVFLLSLSSTKTHLPSVCGFCRIFWDFRESVRLSAVLPAPPFFSLLFPPSQEPPPHHKKEKISFCFMHIHSAYIFCCLSRSSRPFSPSALSQYFLKQTNKLWTVPRKNSVVWNLYLTNLSFSCSPPRHIPYTTLVAVPWEQAVRSGRDAMLFGLQVI